MNHLNKRKKRIQINAFIYTSKWIADVEAFIGQTASPSILAAYASIERELQKELDKRRKDNNDGL